MYRLMVLLFAAVVALPLLAENQTAQDGRLPKVANAPPGGDFTLHMGDESFSLEDLRGKVVLLYFGYTKCPDVCPTSLSYMSQALNGLESDELKTVIGVFVSVDPERDTPERLKEYVAYFHPRLIGVTGTEKEIAQAATLYGARYSKVELEGSAFGYAVNHSAATYLIGPGGELRFILPHDTPSEVITEAIRYVLDGN